MYKIKGCLATCGYAGDELLKEDLLELEKTCLGMKSNSIVSSSVPVLYKIVETKIEEYGDGKFALFVFLE